MKCVTTLFEEALLRKRERGFQFIYVAVDLHGTVLLPTKRTEVSADGEKVIPVEVDEDSDFTEGGFYPGAVKCLKFLSGSPDYKLILWTSATDDTLYDVLGRLHDLGVDFDFINGNPDFTGNGYADFKRKFCFDVLLDDKAGFNAVMDWMTLWGWFMRNGMVEVAEDW